MRQGVMEASRSFAFTSDDRLIAVASREDGRIHLLETATGKSLHTLGKKFDGLQTKGGEPEGLAFNLAFSTDSRLLASWNALDGIIRLWDVETVRERLQLPANRLASYFSWSPDSRLLAISQTKRLLDPVGRPLPQSDDSIQLLELATLGVRRELKGHAGAVRAMAFSPDGKMLASGSADTTLLIWDLATPLRDMAKSLEPTQIEKCWQDLASSDAATAFASLCDLAAAPKQSVAWVRDKLKPTFAADPNHVAKLLLQLESDQFKARQQAVTEMLQIGEQLLPAIDKALAANPALESRLRLQDLRTRLTSFTLQGERLQAFRAVELLERIGSADARQLLRTFADGAPRAMLTSAAQEALARMQ